MQYAGKKFLIYLIQIYKSHFRFLSSEYKYKDIQVTKEVMFEYTIFSSTDIDKSADVPQEGKGPSNCN